MQQIKDAWDRLGASGTTLRSFLKGRISEKVPPGTAVTLYYAVFASAPLRVSRHFAKPQNMGSPPSHTIDTALRKEAWSRRKTAKTY
jgi:hypothetical protein